MELKENTLNNIPEGTVLFEEGNPADHICAVLKGSVEMSAAGIKHILKSGTMLGIADAYNGVCRCSYRARENTLLYVFPVKGVKGMELFLEKYVDYRGISVASMSRLTTAINTVRTKMLVATSSLCLSLNKCYEMYKEIAGNDAACFNDIENLEQPELLVPEGDSRLICRAEQAQLPIETNKFYFEKCANLAAAENEEMSEIIEALMADCAVLNEYARDMFYIAINREQTSLFDIVVSHLIDISGEEPEEENISRLTDVSDTLIKLDNTIAENTGENILDKGKLEELLGMLSAEGCEKRKAENSRNEAKLEIEIQNKIASLKDSAKQITGYAELDDSKTAVFISSLDFMAAASDRMEVSDEMRQKKHALTPIFYEAYRRCLVKSLDDKKLPLAVELFLNYGFADERLVNDSQLKTLCLFKEELYHGQYNIYTAYTAEPKIRQGIISRKTILKT